MRLVKRGGVAELGLSSPRTFVVLKLCSVYWKIYEEYIYIFICYLYILSYIARKILIRRWGFVRLTNRIFTLSFVNRSRNYLIFFNKIVLQKRWCLKNWHLMCGAQKQQIEDRLIIIKLTVNGWTYKAIQYNVFIFSWKMRGSLIDPWIKSIKSINLFLRLQFFCRYGQQCLHKTALSKRYIDS